MPDIMSSLIWVQTVCKSYQQTTIVGRELNKRFKLHFILRGCLHAIKFKKKKFQLLIIVFNPSKHRKPCKIQHNAASHLGLQCLGLYSL